MAKYYVRSGWVRLVLDARTAQDAAVRAIEWSLAGRAEIFREPERERMREIEALEFQLDDEIEVSEVGFRPGSGEVFDVLDLPAVRPAARPCSAGVCGAG
jgi:hypothetical protein